MPTTNDIKFRVTGATFRYDDDRGNPIDEITVDLNFSTTDPLNQLFLNGRVPVTQQQYFAAATSMERLNDLVKDYVVKRINGEIEIEVPEEEEE